MNTRDRQAQFQNLLEGHKCILYKVCHAYCRNGDDRDDLAQEIVVQLWGAFGKFDGRVRFSTWMYRIALNVAISFYRRENTRKRLTVPVSEHLLDVGMEPPNEPEEVLLLYQFIGGLDPLNKALMLLYLDGNSYAEIGDVLGISETNVATKISRLKKRMQEELGAAERASA